MQVWEVVYSGFGEGDVIAAGGWSRLAFLPVSGML
jgi:hypothetical protein